MPAHNLIYNLKDNTTSTECYFEIETNLKIGQLNEIETIKEYKTVFQRSVNLRMRSDVKVGTCLSGGMDSSAVAAFASPFYQNNGAQQFTAIHAQTTESKFDESDKARIVSQHCNLNLHIIQPTEKDFQDALDEVIFTQEEPFGSPSVYLQYFVLKKARELKCLVMLDGQGGDETLLGYEKYYPAYIIAQKGFLNKWRAYLKSSENSTLSRKKLLSYFFYFTRYKIRLNHLKRRACCIKPEFLDNYQSPEIKKLSSAYLDIDELQRFEIGVLPLPELLRYEDKNSMRHGIETRLPFLDYQVLQTALSINHNFKIHNGWTKYVLRKTVQNLLPESIVWRKNKFGFNAPEKSWLDQLDSQINDEIRRSDILKKFIIMDELNLQKTDLRTKWRLFNLARWQTIFHVKTN
ncbi:MAG: asparagine synthase [Crocinitomicaceae bacterium]|nr:asparagine synthase [Crocinitomicaceae bacterium]